jgi:endogenous inhibitor of DNA gyrase (YacG/DUF329 family)
MTRLEKTERVVRCPECGGESVYAVSNPARPFCSMRCKNADLGAWATESFRVAAGPGADDLEIDDLKTGDG